MCWFSSSPSYWGGASQRPLEFSPASNIWTAAFTQSPSQIKTITFTAQSRASFAVQMCSAGFLRATWSQTEEIFAVKCLFGLEGCTKLEKSWCNGPDYPPATVHLVLNSSLWMERCTCWITLSLLNLQCIYLQPWSDVGLTSTLFCRRAGGGLMRSDVQLALIKPTENATKNTFCREIFGQLATFLCFPSILLILRHAGGGLNWSGILLVVSPVKSLHLWA